MTRSQSDGSVVKKDCCFCRGFSTHIDHFKPPRTPEEENPMPPYGLYMFPYSCARTDACRHTNKQIKNNFLKENFSLMFERAHYSQI